MSSQETTEAIHGCLWQSWSLGHCPVCVPETSKERPDGRSERSTVRSRNIVARIGRVRSRLRKTGARLGVPLMDCIGDLSEIGTLVHDLFSWDQWLFADPLGNGLDLFVIVVSVWSLL